MVLFQIYNTFLIYSKQQRHSDDYKHNKNTTVICCFNNFVHSKRIPIT